MKEGTTKTFDSTKFLKNKSNEIDQIIAVIANVSEQTNLLSLNASIEAARAGEAGKGFAVVANEIRTLSDNTNKSLQNIAKIINNFKSSILDVENLMLNNNTNITGGVRILTDIVKELKTNINNLNNVNTDVNEITIFINKLLKEIDTVVNLNEKISNGTELIVDEFKTVTVAIENNTAVSEELNTSAEELNDIATNMSSLID
ncbi:methyl-accepting chemotaxis protein [Clostridium cochlearium]|uniref:methyl-accepting chemotaxis protein n=1 Tax=Clostridium cochlearium TaxID=1494 RepID=UPI0023EA52B1|nr:methyl-accepting chemotaxis protein [Clostridium cochlearium]